MRRRTARSCSTRRRASCTSSTADTGTAVGAGVREAACGIIGRRIGPMRSRQSIRDRCPPTTAPHRGASPSRDADRSRRPMSRRITADRTITSAAATAARARDAAGRAQPGDRGAETATSRRRPSRPTSTSVAARDRAAAPESVPSAPIAPTPQPAADRLHQRHRPRPGASLTERPRRPGRPVGRQAPGTAGDRCGGRPPAERPGRPERRRPARPERQPAHHGPTRQHGSPRPNGNAGPERSARAPGPDGRRTERPARPERRGTRSPCTAPQLRRFIKSRPYVPMHELRRRFAIDGGDDDVSTSSSIPAASTSACRPARARSSASCCVAARSATSSRSTRARRSSSASTRCARSPGPSASSVAAATVTPRIAAAFACARARPRRGPQRVAAVAAERAVRGDDPVARDQQADRVAAERAADGPGGPRRPDPAGDLAVARGLAPADRRGRRRARADPSPAGRPGRSVHGAPRRPAREEIGDDRRGAVQVDPPRIVGRDVPLLERPGRGRAGRPRTGTRRRSQPTRPPRCPGSWPPGGTGPTAPRWSARWRSRSPSSALTQCAGRRHVRGIGH